MLRLVKDGEVRYTATTASDLEIFIKRLMDWDEVILANKAFYQDDGTEYEYSRLLCLLEHCSVLDEYSLEKE